MPVAKSKSALVAKLGDKIRKAHEAHKGDETEYSSFGELPAGIEGGIAQLVDCKFDVVKEGKDNAGEYYFYAAGTVMEPKEFTDSEGNLHRVEGLRTSITEPIYDTPNRKSRKTVDDHLAFVLNEMRKLGVDTSSIGAEQLEDVCEQLKQLKPFFRFRTWKGQAETTGPYAGKEPRVQHVWNGCCDYDGGHSDGGRVQDDSGPPEDAPAPVAAAAAATRVNAVTQARKPGANGSNGAPAAAQAKPTPATNRPQQAQRGMVEARVTGNKAPSPHQAQEPEPAAGFDEFGDLGTLATLADTGDTNAAAQLTEMAEKAGVTDEQIGSVQSWHEVVALMSGDDGTDPGDGEVNPEAETPVPAVGELWFYTPQDQKSGKPGKQVEVEILAVFHDKETCNLKDLANHKVVYRNVSWSKIRVNAE